MGRLGELGRLEGGETGQDILSERKIYFQLKKKKEGGARELVQ